MITPTTHARLQRFHLVRLYLEDARAIERVLLDIEGKDDPRVEIKSPRWTADDVDGLLAKAELGPFTEFSFARSDVGYVSVELRPIETLLYVSDMDDLQLYGAFEKISVILRRARLNRFARFLCSSLGFGVVAGVMVGALSFGLPKAARTHGFQSYIWVAIVVAAIALIALFCYSLIVSFRQDSTLVLQPRRDRPSYLRRNRDQITVGFVLALLSSGFGALITWLLVGHG